MLARLLVIGLPAAAAFLFGSIALTENDWLSPYAPWPEIIGGAAILTWVVLAAFHPGNADHWAEVERDFVGPLLSSLRSWGWRGFLGLAVLLLTFTLLAWFYVWVLSTEAGRSYAAVGLAIATLWAFHRIANPVPRPHRTDRGEDRSGGA